jgi:hypothetical protein
MGTEAGRRVLLVAIVVLSNAGCASNRSGSEPKKSVGDRLNTAWMETMIFTSETVPMAIVSPVMGTPDEQKERKWYQRRLP